MLSVICTEIVPFVKNIMITSIHIILLLHDHLSRPTSNTRISIARIFSGGEGHCFSSKS